MNGISLELPDTERARLKKILKDLLPDNVGVIVRTAAEGATDEQLTHDVNRLTSQWAVIMVSRPRPSPAPALLHSEPDLLIKVVRDVFNEDFQKMVISGEDSREIIESYLRHPSPRTCWSVSRSTTTPARMPSTSTASPSRSRRPSTARSSCPPAARWSSTAQRP